MIVLIIPFRLETPFSRFHEGSAKSARAHGGHSPFLQGQPHEAFPVFQRNRVCAGSALKGLGGSADDNDYGVSRPILGQQVVDGVLVDRTDTCEQHKEGSAIIY